ncbi:MAG: arsenate reductase ArsC [Burkholderiaceae bacterium]
MTTHRPINVLFLCTHNSARSILAEGLLNHIGAGRFLAYSAGSSPRENQQPHPMALRVLQEAGIATNQLRSKSWDEFGQPSAQPMDLVITVCDNAANEVCPYWPGGPASAHWGFSDPSESTGSAEKIHAAFRATLLAIRHRIELLTGLPETNLAGSELQASVRRLEQA